MTFFFAAHTVTCACEALSVVPYLHKARKTCIAHGSKIVHPHLQIAWYWALLLSNLSGHLTSYGIASRSEMGAGHPAQKHSNHDGFGLLHVHGHVVLSDACLDSIPLRLRGNWGKLCELHVESCCKGRASLFRENLAGWAIGALAAQTMHSCTLLGYCCSASMNRMGNQSDLRRWP